MKKGLYIRLFGETFRLSACTFGGGFVIIPLMRKRFVEELKWIEEQEMLDLTAIAQSSPGAIAVNAAILIGYHAAGIKAALRFRIHYDHHRCVPYAGTADGDEHGSAVHKVHDLPGRQEILAALHHTRNHDAERHDYADNIRDIHCRKSTPLPVLGIFFYSGHI